MSRLFTGAFLFLTCTVLAHAQCFAPLTDPKSNKTSDWNQLVQFAPEVHEDGVVRVQAIKDGMGPINLDFYAITFRKPAAKTVGDVFLDIRKHFSSFAHREASAYEGESGQYFLPYRGSSSDDDPLHVRNKALWESKDPKGAVMSFVLAYHTPALAFAATLKGMKIVLEQGDVVATCTSPSDSPTQFIFSTVFTAMDEYHPVNGNRGFGLRDNNDGTLTFYSMGADRETKVGTAYGHGAAIDRPYFGNEQLKAGAMSPAIDAGPDAVFQAGDKFWRDFFFNLGEYLDHQGMTGNPSSFVRNTNRYHYPLN